MSTHSSHQILFHPTLIIKTLQDIFPLKITSPLLPNNSITVITISQRQLVNKSRARKTFVNKPGTADIFKYKLSTIKRIDRKVHSISARPIKRDVFANSARIFHPAWN